VRDVDLFLVVAGEGEVEPVEAPVAAPGGDLVAIVEVARRMLLAEEEPISPQRGALAGRP